MKRAFNIAGDDLLANSPEDILRLYKVPVDSQKWIPIETQKSGAREKKTILDWLGVSGDEDFNVLIAKPVRVTTHLPLYGEYYVNGERAPMDSCPGDVGECGNEVEAWMEAHVDSLYKSLVAISRRSGSPTGEWVVCSVSNQSHSLGLHVTKLGTLIGIDVDIDPDIRTPVCCLCLGPRVDGSQFYYLPDGSLNQWWGIFDMDRNRRFKKVGPNLLFVQRKEDETTCFEMFKKILDSKEVFRGVARGFEWTLTLELSFSKNALG
jgi:hypothetical protein